MISKLQSVIEVAGKGFENYVFNLPLQEVRSFVWHELADYYLEMVKYRLYKPEIYGEESKKAAQWTLMYILENVLKLMAPITPHVTEEIYSELFKEKSAHEKSIHLSAFPKPDKKLVDAEAEKDCAVLVKIIDAVRKHKSESSMSLGAELEKAVIEAPDAELDAVKKLEQDIKGTCRIGKLEVKKGKELKVAF